MKNLIVTLAILISIFVNNRNTNAQWVQRYNGPGNSYDAATSIAVDNLGNVYVLGTSTGIGNNKDYATIKYNSFGNQQWIQRYNGPGNYYDYGRSIAVDRSGNVYVTGVSYGIGTNEDYATIKYNSSGVQQWIQRYNGPGNGYDGETSLAVDSSGNIYITGSSTGIGTGTDYATIKYNSNGDSLWVRRYNGPANQSDYAKSIAVDSSGNVYVTGNSYDSGTGSDYATIKYNSSGAQQWTQRYNGPDNSDDFPGSIVVDGSGNICVTGSTGIGTLHDYATIKYNSNGDSLWVKRYNGPANSYDIPSSIAVDISGNVYITGTSTGIETRDDYATIKYNSTGVQQWIQIYNGPGRDYDDYAAAIGVDGSGNIYVSGSSGNPYSGIDYKDYATIKYNSLGIQQWVQIYDGPANSSSEDIASSMKVDGIGNVYVTGSSMGLGTGSDFATIKYSQQALNLTALIEGLYNNVTNKMVEDTLKVYFRNANFPYSIVDSAKSILDSNGNGTFNFPYTFNGILYYVVTKHRNSIEVWSSQGIMFTSNQFSYDFTTAANKSYGNNLVLKGSKYCIYSGDINQDAIVDLSDLTRVDNDAYNSVSGYKATDVNGDNIVDLSDLSIVDNNAFNFVRVIRP